MSVTTKVRITVIASLDTDQKTLQFKRSDETLTTVTRTFDAEESGVAVLSASEANFSLPMGKVVTGQVLYVETDKEITVKLDGEAVGHKVKPDAGITGKLYLDTEFTSAPIVTNDIAEEANVVFFIGGAK